jgi:hypothetical protein
LAGAAPGDVTAGTACGRYRGRRARQPSRPQGFRPEDAAKLPPHDGESPGYLSRLQPVTLAALLSLSVMRACSHAHVQAVRPGAPWRALDDREENPHSNAAVVVDRCLVAATEANRTVPR